MIWGKFAEVEKNSGSVCKWFAWHPVLLYENRYMWWEWCYAHRDRFGDWHYETFFEGKKPCN